MKQKLIARIGTIGFFVLLTFLSFTDIAEASLSSISHGAQAVCSQWSSTFECKWYRIYFFWSLFFSAVWAIWWRYRFLKQTFTENIHLLDYTLSINPDFTNARSFWYKFGSDRWTLVPPEREVYEYKYSSHISHPDLSQHAGVLFLQYMEHWTKKDFNAMCPYMSEVCREREKRKSYKKLWKGKWWDIIYQPKIQSITPIHIWQKDTCMIIRCHINIHMINFVIDAKNTVLKGSDQIQKCTEYMDISINNISRNITIENILQPWWWDNTRKKWSEATFKEKAKIFIVPITIAILVTVVLLSISPKPQISSNETNYTSYNQCLKRLTDDATKRGRLVQEQDGFWAICSNETMTTSKTGTILQTGSLSATGGTHPLPVHHKNIAPTHTGAVSWSISPDK